MARTKNKRAAGVSKLDHRVTVQLKEWAGLSGFYGYKDMDLEQVLALLNTEGWKTEVDSSEPNARVLIMLKDETVRKGKFVLDDKGRALKLH